MITANCESVFVIISEMKKLKRWSEKQEMKKSGGGIIKDGSFDYATIDELLMETSETMVKLSAVKLLLNKI